MSGREGSFHRSPVVLDLLVCGSYVGLLLLPAIAPLVFEGRAEGHYFTVRNAPHHWAALANLGVGTLLLFSFKRITWPRAGGRARTLMVVGGLLLLWLPALQLWRRDLLTPIRDLAFATFGALGGRVGVMVGMGLLGAAVAGAFVRAAVRAPGRVRAGARTGLLVLSPLTLLLTVQMAAIAMGAGPRMEAGNVHELDADRKADGAEDSGHREGARVIFVVFDELDADSLEAAATDGPPLEGFEWIVSEGVRLAETPEPGPWTARAIPALTLGRPVEAAAPVGPTQLALEPAEQGVSVYWAPEETFLAQWRREGGTVGMVGWYHPYCRIFRGHVDACHWEPSSWRQPPQRGGFADWLRLAAGQWATSTLRPPARELEAGARKATERIEKRAHDWATDPFLDLLWVHHTMPHDPVIGEPFVLPSGKEASGYRRNLHRADEFLTTLQASLQDAGLLQETALIVTSDHPRRKQDPEDGGLTIPHGSTVPVLLRLPEDPEPLSLDWPCPPLFLADLSLAILRGQVRSNQEAAEWIRSQAAERCPEAG